MTNGHGFNDVDLPQPPLITMTAVPGYGPAPLTVGFFVNTVDPEGKGFVSYVWNFGDGQVSMDPPLTFFHTYNSPWHATSRPSMRPPRTAAPRSLMWESRCARESSTRAAHSPELIISTLPLSRL